MLTVFVLSLFAAWFGLSIVAQSNHRLIHALRSHDAFSLLPRWTFFVRPGFFDNHLMYRDRLPDDSSTPWREILPAEKRTLDKALWNPAKRCQKAVSDSIDQLMYLRKADPEQALALTMPYLAILNCVTSQPHNPQATATQFMIVRTAGFVSEGKPRLIFRSDWTAIPR